MSNSPSLTPTADESDAVRLEHWCHQCQKRVAVETVENSPEVICHECKNGFVEAIQAIPSDADRGDSSLSSQFEYVLRLLRQVAGEDDGVQPPTQDPPSEDDFFGVELDGWYNEEDDDEENENDNEENEEGNNDNGEEEDRSVDENEENRNTGDDSEEDLRRITREVLLRRARNQSRRRSRQNQWTEIRMGLGNSIELRFELSDSDRYIGNPEDYVDAAGFEELLQNLAESDIGRRGAPPAAKSAVSGLPTVEILKEAEAVVCAICKDVVGVGGFMKKLPCGHGYHGDCIVQWLGTRNSCPVCRFELPTDDAEYEEERKKRGLASVDGASASASGVSDSGSS
ncbi:hypothetical protein SLE2022_098440 [Rubroshorea leprosula]